MNNDDRRIHLMRYPAVDGPSRAAEASIARHGGRWVASDELGGSSVSDDLAGAIASLASAAFSPGEVLRITTGGLAKPTDLPPMLGSWIDAAESESVDMADWSGDDERAGWWWEELAGSYSDSWATMLLDRFVMIDEQLCAVLVDGDVRAAVLFDGDEDPVFSAPWASFGLHNGYGWSRYVRGLVAPDVHCELFDMEGMKHISLSRTVDAIDDDLVRRLLAWADSHLSHDTEHRGTRLQVDDEGQFVVSDEEHIIVTGGIDRVLWESRSANPVLGEDRT